MSETSESPQPRSASAPASPKKRRTLSEIEVDLQRPEPPSKRAKRFLKKGKPLPEKSKSDVEGADSDDDDDGVPTGKTKDGKEKKRSDYGVWIGNLPFTVTRVELFKWLLENSGGAIAEAGITRVNLPATKGGETGKPQNRGFAYVDFANEAAAVAAKALTETEIAGRKVLIKDSKSFDGRPQKQTAEASATADGGTAGTTAKRGLSSRKIYVGNLSFQTTEDDVRENFEHCGKIQWVKVATFEDTGKCKGYGWVKFWNDEAAASAVRGFVRIKEELETEDDFKEDGDADEEPKEPEEAKDKKRFKTRKWWVNRIKGRELKVEFAEDDQVRYKKRYGRDAPARGVEDNGVNKSEAGAEKSARETKAVERRKKAGYGDSQVATYKTGGIVPAQGQKITFD